MYRNVIRGGPSHNHRQRAQIAEVRPCIFFSYVSEDTDRQTDRHTHRSTL